MLSPEAPNETKDDQAVMDRRQWTRYSSDLKQVVVMDQPSEIAAITDESFGGIAIIVPDARGLIVDRPIKLLYSGAPMVGIVRRIEPASEGGSHVGIQWCDRAANRQSAGCPPVLRSFAQFIRLQSLKLVCDLVGVDGKDESVLCVRLPDGSEVRSSPECLTTTLYHDRRKELLALGRAVTMLLGLYQLGEQETQDSAVDAILTFEYSCCENRA